MKKRGLGILLILLMLLLFTGCNQQQAETDKPQIICTVFPQYDWVRNVLGDHEDEFQLNLLMDNGADLHNYQATVTDLVDISQCDLFIYVGGESDDWVEDALEDPTNENRKTLALMDLTSPIPIEHDHEEEENSEEEHDHSAEEYDEHVWLSLKNADAAVAEIADLLCEIDPDNAADYTANAASYRAEIHALDTDYQTCVDTAARTTVVFADRFPFAYLARDYGLTYYAAFTGCSAETEASFSTISMLSEKVDELSLPVVMVIETSDQSIAETVVANTQDQDQEIVVTDSMQSVTQSRIDEGTTYLGIMESNLTAFEKALH